MDIDRSQLMSNFITGAVLNDELQSDVDGN